MALSGTPTTEIAAHLEVEDLPTAEAWAAAAGRATGASPAVKD
jgi:hypothetical protein